MRFPGFIGHSYKLNTVNVDCQRLINLYPVVNESGHGKEQETYSLVSTPGLRSLVTVGSGPIRGTFVASNGRTFCVSGNKLYELDSDWNETELGTLNSDENPVSFADNGTVLVVVDDADGYVLTFATNAFVEITDPDFPGAIQVTHQDGYFIFVKPDSGQFFISGLNDTTFDALDIATSEGNPDLLVGVLSDHRDLWLFNSKTIEVFYNSGNADFPFERIQGAFIEHGLCAKNSVAKGNNTVFWLGQDDKGAGIVYMARGYQPQPISTTPVTQAIQSYSNLEDAVGFTYQQDDHLFYVLNFPSADTTWVYDTKTGGWHERAYTNQGTLERHRANCHAYAFGTHIVGDYENGNIYELTSLVYTDNGNEITRQRVAPHISSGGKRIFYSQFLLDVETGVGIDGVGQGSDPNVILDFSTDGGHSWSNEKWASLGRLGNRKTRAKWNRLGSARDMVFRITITDPVKVTLIGADIEFEVGNS